MRNCINIVIVIWLCYTDLYVNAVCTRGERSSHPTDCRKFRICDHNKWFIFNCAPFTAWNQKLRTCVWPIDANCDSIPEVDPCDSNPCMNGGKCESLGNTFACICTTGFSGETCQSDNDPCSSSPCGDGGSCIPSGSDHTCICGNGYSGSNCQYGINTFCGSTPAGNPCVGGKCYNDINRYRCVCEDGFAGNPCRDCNELWQCPFHDIPYILPDAVNNSQYMMCIDGTKQKLYCPAGQIFRPFLLQCS